jgi:hypothetical protein
MLQVWKIYCTKPLNDAYVQYRSRVEQERGLAGGNTRRRFHGTIRACCLGDDDRNRDLCNVSTCSLCRIIRVSNFTRSECLQLKTITDILPGCQVRRTPH